MKPKYRVYPDGTLIRIFPGGIKGSFVWPDIDSIYRAAFHSEWKKITKNSTYGRLGHAI